MHHPRRRIFPQPRLPAAFLRQVNEAIPYPPERLYDLDLARAQRQRSGSEWTRLVSHSAYPIDIYAAASNIFAMTARSSLFKSNRSQAVRLPKELAFPDEVKQVAIRKVGKARIILPADAAWDDFFDAPGVNLEEREQPEAERREPF